MGNEKRKGIELIETIIRYLLSAAPRDHIMYEDIKDAVEKSLSNIGGEIMPTIADSLIEKGMQQGSIQTARESVIDSLEVRFEVVPESLVKKINGISDPSILRILHRQAIKVKSLDEFTEVIKSILK